MELLHQQVHHAKFGDGEIVQQAETCVTVAFTAPFEEKHFLYPDAFAAFLTLCDPVQQRKMQQLLQQLLKRRSLKSTKLEARVYTTKTHALERFPV